MASTITRVKTIRMNNATADWLDGVNPRKALEGFYRLVESGKAEYYDGEVVIPALQTGVHSNKREEALIRSNNECMQEIRELHSQLGDIEEMSQSLGISREGFLAGLKGLIERGNLWVRTGEMVVGAADECPFNWMPFVEACDEMGHDYEAAMKKILPILYKV